MLIQLTIQLNVDPICPSCLTILSSRNVKFFGRFAFCCECLDDPDSSDPEAAVWAIVNYLHVRHLHVHRNLAFFAPQAPVSCPVQALPFASQWFWRQEVSFDDHRSQLSDLQRKLALLQIQKLEH